MPPWVNNISVVCNYFYNIFSKRIRTLNTSILAPILRKMKRPTISFYKLFFCVLYMLSFVHFFFCFISLHYTEQLTENLLCFACIRLYLFYYIHWVCVCVLFVIVCKGKIGHLFTFSIKYKMC